MFIAAFGPPCPTTKWGLHLLRTIVDVALGEHDFITSSSLAQLKAEWPKRTHEHLVYFSDCPEAAIVDLFARSESPIIVFTEEPRDVVAITAKEKNISLVDAIRSTSKHFAALHDLFVKSNTNIFRRPTRPTSLRKGIELFADTYAIKLDAKMIDVISAKLCKLHRSDEVADMLLAIDQFAGENKRGDLIYNTTGSDKALLEAVIDPLAGVIAGQELVAVTWPKAMFFDSDKKGEAFGSPIELIGQTRQLTYGPYLYLPRGSWRAIFFLAFKNSRSTNFLRADILCNVKEIMGVGDFETIGDGNFTVELPFQVGEPIFPLEARLSLRGGAIEGSLDLLKIEMRRDTSSAAEET